MSEVVRLRFPRLNTLIACASVVVQRRIKSHDGLELTLQINHLSHIVLFNELLPLLELNSPSRILTIGSMLHNLYVFIRDRRSHISGSCIRVLFSFN
ncbi:unnamed protein product [Meloidogyne enterolobii]|uniref:Uncharacterized protein n=1 Tax=Meloidogyne enterolobii TaxID=390850 RepID=A0ACB1A9P8_MELEN